MRLIFMTGVRDTLDIFSYELIKAFNADGVETFEFNTKDMTKSLGGLYGFLKEPVAAAITFNNLGFSMELSPGRKMWDDLSIYCVNILMDHPYMHAKALSDAPEHSVVLCPDRNHMNYVQRFYPSIPVSGFLPHGGVDDGDRGCNISKREIDFLYTGGLSKRFIKEAMPDFSKFKFDAKKIADEAIEDLVAHPSKTAELAIEEALKNKNIILPDEELREVIAKLQYVDMTATSYYREKTIRTLAENGINVVIYGTGWEDCDWIKTTNADFRGRISAYEAAALMKRSKIVLNTMTWFKDGTHDRVFNGMLAGACAVTDSSVYMDETFGKCRTLSEAEEGGLLMFDLSDIASLPEKLKDLLSDGKRLQTIADRGYELARRDHSWQSRAKELKDDLLSQL